MKVGCNNQRLLEDNEFVDYLLSLSTGQASEGGSTSLSHLMNAAKHDPQKVKRWLDGILELYLNDKNSSSVREYVTYQMVKRHYEKTNWELEYNREKLGYDAKAEKNVNGRKLTLYIELKPKNAYDKLGYGDLYMSISDYTPERLEKDLGNVNPNSFLAYVVSGFIRGRLVYVIETPFICVMPTLLESLIKRYATDEKRNAFLESNKKIKERVHELVRKFANLDIEVTIGEITGTGLFKEIEQTTREILDPLKSKRDKNSYLRSVRVPRKEIESCPMTRLLCLNKAIYDKSPITTRLRRYIDKLDRKSKGKDAEAGK